MSSFDNLYFSDEEQQVSSTSVGKSTRRKKEKSNSSGSRPKLSELSDQEKYEHHKRNIMLYHQFLKRVPCINPGSKQIPDGKPNCLSGLIFHVTGVLESITQDEARNLIKKLGGHVSATLGKRTNYLISGEEPGWKKTENAQSFNVPIISLDEFFDIIRQRSSDDFVVPFIENKKPTPRKASKTKATAETDSNSEPKPKIAKRNVSATETGQGKNQVEKSKTETLPKESVSPKKIKTETSPNKIKTEKLKTETSPKKIKNEKIETETSPKKVKNEKSVSASTSKKIITEIAATELKPQEKLFAIAPSSSTKNEKKIQFFDGLQLQPKEPFMLTEIKTDNDLPWVDKYSPKSTRDIVDQQVNVTKLLHWLENWKAVPPKCQKSNPWARNSDGASFRAVLLSGPPGIGKTTTAKLVCQQLGYDVVEFNASDTRNKRMLNEQVSKIIMNTSIFNTSEKSKRAVVMDEIDGMSGNEDRGGMSEMIYFIKQTKVPIICICNDRNHQKIRSLVNYCFDLRFERPRTEVLKGFLKNICYKEKITIEPNKLSEIISASNNDIRQCINFIYMLSAELKGHFIKPSTATKDVKVSVWDTMRKIFSSSEHKNMSMNDKSDLFFHDYNLNPLFVQQNYLAVTPDGNREDDLEKIAKAADAMSLGDVVNKSIRSSGSNWSLLPVQAALSSILPGDYMEGRVTGMINFPSWFGKNARGNKLNRLAQEMYHHTRQSTSGSRTSIRLEYAPHILSNIVRPLEVSGTQGIDSSLSVIRDYGLLRTDIDSLGELTKWPGKKSRFEALDGKLKGALTRSYNKQIRPYSYSATENVKRKRPNAGFKEDQIDDNENDSYDEIDDDTIENDTLIKAKKRKTKLIFV